MKQITAYVSKIFTVTRERSEFGTSSIDIECPFCQTNTTAYMWSLAGSGKKCPGCGAIHHWRGSITKKKLPPICHCGASQWWVDIKDVIRCTLCFQPFEKSYPQLVGAK